MRPGVRTRPPDHHPGRPLPGRADSPSCGRCPDQPSRGVWVLGPERAPREFAEVGLGCGPLPSARSCRRSCNRGGRRNPGPGRLTPSVPHPGLRTCIPASFLGVAGGATLAVMLHTDGPGKTLGAHGVCSCAHAQTLQPVRGPAEALTRFRKTHSGKPQHVAAKMRNTVCPAPVREAPPSSGLSGARGRWPRSHSRARGRASCVTDLGKGREGPRTGQATHTRPETSKLRGLRTLTEATGWLGRGHSFAPDTCPQTPLVPKVPDLLWSPAASQEACVWSGLPPAGPGSRQGRFHVPFLAHAWFLPTPHVHPTVTPPQGPSLLPARPRPRLALLSQVPGFSAQGGTDEAWGLPGCGLPWGLAPAPSGPTAAADGAPTRDSPRTCGGRRRPCPLRSCDLHTLGSENRSGTDRGEKEENTAERTKLDLRVVSSSPMSGIKST